MNYQKFKEKTESLQGITSKAVKRYIVQSLILLVALIVLGVVGVRFCFPSHLFLVVVCVVLLLALYSLLMEYMTLDRENFMQVYGIVHKLYIPLTLVSIAVSIFLTL